MLKHIPDLMPPELMKVIMEMGHGDELLLCDGNYPKFGCPERCVRMDGHGIREILDMLLKFFPLDAYVEHPVALMAVLPGDPYKPEIWEYYREIGEKHDADGLRDETIDKNAFYTRGQRCYACVATGEKALYANVILKKGIVK
ncbi:MAG: fucose isomerase [Clostridiales bacterium]|nr:fucose isomerase [Clostridiales bacterium]